MTLIMGVLNITPDSFFDGGKFNSVDEAVKQAEQLVKDGADILDIGAESTRPGAIALSAEQEIERLAPVITAIASRLSIPISIDTYKASVAKVGLDLGATIINDISGLDDPQMAPTIAQFGAKAVIMHKQGTPSTMQTQPQYSDVIAEVKAFLRERIDRATAAGISEIWIDPGIGFGKSLPHNLTLLAHLDQFKDLNRPIAIGTSQKRFIGDITGAPADERLAGTIASCIASLARGATLFRVHHVKEVKQALMVANAISEHA